jgi:hypothetical protein
MSRIVRAGVGCAGHSHAEQHYCYKDRQMFYGSTYAAMLSPPVLS